MHFLYSANQYKEPINTKLFNQIQHLNKMNENIRLPDKPIRERLLPTTNYYEPHESEEDQLRRALEESENDYEFQLAVLESQRIEQEREERMKHFAGFRSKITQFMRIDKPNHEFYYELLIYIDKYESGNILSVVVPDEFYMKFQRTLGNMRLSAEDKNRLNEFIKN